MSGAVHDADYLDAIFAAIRAFARDLEAAKRWLACADRTDNRAFRLSFLQQARAALSRASEDLAAVAARLGALGPAGSLPAPLDRIEGNLSAMRRDLSALAERLAEAEAAAPSIGSA